MRFVGHAALRLFVLTFSWIAITAALLTAAHAGEQPSAPPAGLRVFYTGHSFHMFVPRRVEQIVKAAGVDGHILVGTQGIGGSRVIQHWSRPDEKNTAKKALKSGEVDVFTMAAHVNIPDEGITNFTKFGLEQNPKLRLLVQASWYPFDVPSPEVRIRNNAQRDDMKIEALQVAVNGWRSKLEAQADELNKTHDRQAVFIVPVGDAVVKLRALVVEGNYPGVKTQSELFTDPIGHAGPHVQALAAYCNFAAIYRMNPEGLKIDVKGVDDVQNSILQHLAWETVSNYKYAGVTDEEPCADGARAIEGAPEDGLPYRVLVGAKATPEAPHRMVVWLHPAGGSMNNVVERLASQLNEQELALVLSTKKDFRGWSQLDAKKMMITLEVLGETKGISAEEPLLLGYSAGGQLALMLWSGQPDRWGGLILVAAYPITFDPETRKAKLADLPADAEAVKQTHNIQATLTASQ